MYEITKPYVFTILHCTELNYILGYSVGYKSGITVDGVQILPGGIVICTNSLLDTNAERFLSRVW